MRGGLANAGARADDHDNLPIEFFFRRHSSQLCFFQRPVFDVESLLSIHRLVLVDCFRAAHHFDGAIVKLRSDARLTLVLSPGDHAQSRNQHDGRIVIAHRGGIRPLAFLVVTIVILAILDECLGERVFQPLDIKA